MAQAELAGMGLTWSNPAVADSLVPRGNRPSAFARAYLFPATDTWPPAPMSLRLIDDARSLRTQSLRTLGRLSFLNTRPLALLSQIYALRNAGIPRNRSMDDSRPSAANLAVEDISRAFFNAPVALRSEVPTPTSISSLDEDAHESSVNSAASLTSSNPLFTNSDIEGAEEPPGLLDSPRID